MGQASREEKEPNISGEFPRPNEGGQEGHGHPQRRNDVRGSGGREGPHLPGSTWRQNGRGREAAGVRYLRSEDEELELARVLGQCRAAPRRRETSLRL